MRAQIGQLIGMSEQSENTFAGKKRLGAPSPIPPNYRNLSRVALDRLVITEASTFTPPWRT
jgi:hypothetical protein